MTWINQKLQLVKAKWGNFATTYLARKPAMDREFLKTYHAGFKYIQIVIHVIWIIVGLKTQGTKEEVFNIGATGNVIILLLNFGILIIGTTMIKANLLIVFAELLCFALNIAFTIVTNIKFCNLEKQPENSYEEDDVTEDLLVRPNNTIFSLFRPNITNFSNISSNNTYGSSDSTNCYILHANSTVVQRISAHFMGDLDPVETIIMTLYYCLLSQLWTTVYAFIKLYRLEMKSGTNSRFRRRPNPAPSPDFERYNNPLNLTLYANRFQMRPYTMALDNISERSRENSSRRSSVIDRDEEFAVELNYDEKGYNNKK